MGVDFELREYGRIGQIKNAVLKGELDLIPVAIVTPDREIYLDFTNNYHRSGLGIAVRAESAGYDWLRIADRLVSLQFLSIIGFLVLLWMIAGTLVWLFEG